MLPLKSWSAPTRRTLAQAGDVLQLVVLRRVIRVNRAIAHARQWLKPIEGWLWLMPLSFIVGLVGGYFLQTR